MPFDPAPWDNKEIVWDNKLFVKDRITSFLHIPLNFGQKVVKNIKLIEAVGAEALYQLMLTDENSLWGADIYIDVAKEVKEHTGKDHVPGTVVISAPTDLKKIEKLKKVGFDSVAFNLEVWDRNIFAGICPGKARTIGWKNYLRALEYAGKIFEHGKVRSMFVSGHESKDSFLKGAEYLASKNVLAFPMPWTPNPGSKLEGHRTPQPSWHLDLSRKLVDIWLHYDYTVDHLKELPLSRNYLYFDEMAGRA